MNTFTLYWLDGKRETCKGRDIADAMNKKGYGNGAIMALDFHAKGNCMDYVWNEKTHNWDMTETGKLKLFARKCR